MEGFRAILLPGSAIPAGPAYDALLAALGPEVDAVAKNLELYEGDSPPAGWRCGTDAAGVLRVADAGGWETFHLVGYSGGGAASLAFTARHPERLLSLALLEPVWPGPGTGVPPIPGSGSSMSSCTTFRPNSSWLRSRGSA